MGRYFGASGDRQFLFFVLKVKAKDFSAPTFNISVQSGFASDLSGAGIITNGFTSQDASQVALLQRTMIPSTRLIQR